MTIILNYGISTGKLAGGEVFEREVDLTPEQEGAYMKAALAGKPFEDYPELRALLQDEYDEIADEELDPLIEEEDEYAMECMGLAEVDPDEINDLVYNKDPHAIAFFGLEDLSDEELEDWDANDLDELPTIADFVEDFEPESPFDCGWTLNVSFADEYVDNWFQDDAAFNFTKETANELIRDAMKAGDFEFVDDVVEAQREYYSEDAGELEQAIYRIAKDLGLDSYAEERWGTPAD